MTDLKEEQGRGIEDLLDARAALARHPALRSFWARRDLFRVSASFYGQAPQSITGSCPVIASYGARDAVTARAATQLARALADSGIAHDFKVYAGAGHSFMTDAPNAWLRTLGIL